MHVRAQIEIKKADADMYVAIIDDKVTVKLGPRYDMGDLAPKQEEVCRSHAKQHPVPSAVARLLYEVCSLCWAAPTPRPLQTQ
jgi:Alpha-amylase C-terminal beta-sheet domain